MQRQEPKLIYIETSATRDRRDSRVVVRTNSKQNSFLRCTILIITMKNIGRETQSDECNM